MHQNLMGKILHLDDDDRGLIVLSWLLTDSNDGPFPDSQARAGQLGKQSRLDE